VRRSRFEAMIGGDDSEHESTNPTSIQHSSTVAAAAGRSMVDSVQV